MSAMILDKDLLRRVFAYECRGYEVLVTDRGLHLRRIGTDSVVLALSAERLTILTDKESV